MSGYESHEKTVVCDCGSMEHIIRFMWWNGTDPQDSVIYVHYFLQNNGFFERVVNAIKYIFGFKSKYGHFGEVLINIDKAEKLSDFLNEFINTKTQ